MKFHELSDKFLVYNAYDALSLIWINALPQAGSSLKMSIYILHNC